MKSPFSRTQLCCAFFAVSMLSACGDGNDFSATSSPDSPPPPPPVVTPNNGPEAASDQASSRDHQPVTVDVLANDVDADEDSLTLSKIIREPQNGSVSIVDNKIVYTANSGHVGGDVLTYEVTDGNASATAQLTLSNEQSAMLSGVVTDGPIPNATVSVEMGGEVFQTTADENGNYSLPIVLKSLNDLVILNAVGSEANQQDFVELMSFVGSTQELVLLAIEDRAVSAEQLHSLNVTHLSTANAILAIERNQGEMPADSGALKTLIGEIDANKILDVAAFIKLLVDDPAYSVAEGQTSLSLLTGETFSNVEDAIENYLSTAGLLDEENAPLTSHVVALEQAVSETIDDPIATAKFREEMISGKLITFANSDLRDGWVHYQGRNFLFNQDGTGSAFTVGAGTPRFVYGFDWKVEQGKLIVTYDQEVVFEFNSYFSIDAVAEKWGQAAADEVSRQLDSGELPSLNSLFLNTRWTQSTFTLISEGDSLKVSENFVDQETLVLGENLTFDAFNESISRSRFYAEPESIFKNGAFADMLGTWAIPLVYNFVAELNGQPIDHPRDGDFNTDILTLNQDTTVSAQFSGESFFYSFVDGVIILQNEEKRYEITPFLGDEAHATSYIKYFSGDSLEYAYTSTIAKFDPNFAVGESDFVIELPRMLASGVGGSYERFWEDNVYGASRAFGYRFLEDGTMTFVTPNVCDTCDDPLVFFDSDKWDWVRQGNLLTMDFEFTGGNPVANRKLEHVMHVISKNESGRILAVRYQTHVRFVGDSMTEFDVLSIREPRIQILQTLDLLDYGTAYERSIELGALDQ